MAHIPLTAFDLGDRQLYIITAESDGLTHNCYCMAIWRAGSRTAKGHWTAYINVDRSAWNHYIDDARIDGKDITFEGVGSNELSIPLALSRTIPVMDHGYWVGCDWMGREATIADVMDKMESVFSSYISVPVSVV